ncbi:MAG: hypothetical protein WD733_05850 [Bryobacterales bacterium]
MIPRTLVRQIEQNADKLAADVVRTIKSDRRAAAYHQLSDQKFEEYVLDLYQNLGQWLRSRTWSALETIYERKGRDRYHDGMPLSHVVFAFTETKVMLLEYIRSSVEGDQTDRDMELQLVITISQFFDRVIYHIVMGYDDARRAALAHPKMSDAELLALKKEAQGVRPKGLHPELVAELPMSRSGDVGEVSG